MRQNKAGGEGNKRRANEKKKKKAKGRQQAITTAAFALAPLNSTKQSRTTTPCKRFRAVDLKYSRQILGTTCISYIPGVNVRCAGVG